MNNPHDQIPGPLDFLPAHEYAARLRGNLGILAYGPAVAALLRKLDSMGAEPLPALVVVAELTERKHVDAVLALRN